jgi:hypothetical protein
MDITNKEGVMNLKRLFFLKLLVLILVFSFIGPAFSQSKQGKTRIHAGVIESVSRDFKYISINEHKVLITPQTKVLDEKGNSLDIRELRRGRHVVVELIRNPSGSAEKRIIIKK